MAAIASIASEQLKAALGSAGKKSKGNDRGIFAHDDMMTGKCYDMFMSNYRNKIRHRSYRNEFCSGNVHCRNTIWGFFWFCCHPRHHRKKYAFVATKSQKAKNVLWQWLLWICLSDTMVTSEWLQSGVMVSVNNITIKALLMIAPASIITILVFFSNSYFHADLITCSLRYVHHSQRKSGSLLISHNLWSFMIVYNDRLLW